MNLLLISDIWENPTPPAFGGAFHAHLEKKLNPMVRRASLTAWSLLAWGYMLICPEVRSAQSIPDDLCAGHNTICLQQEKQGFCTCAEATGWGRAEPSPFASDLANDSCLTVSDVSGCESYICQQRGTRLSLGLPTVHFGVQGKPEFADCALQFSLAHSGNFAVALLSTQPCGVDIERVREDVAGRLYHRVLSVEEQLRGLDFFECWTKKECIGKLSGLGIGAHPFGLNTLDESWAGHFYSERFMDDSTGEAYVLSTFCDDDSPLQILRLPQ